METPLTTSPSESGSNQTDYIAVYKFLNQEGSETSHKTSKRSCNFMTFRIPFSTKFGERHRNLPLEKKTETKTKLSRAPLTTVLVNKSTYYLDCRCNFPSPFFLREINKAQKRQHRAAKTAVYIKPCRRIEGPSRWSSYAITISLSALFRLPSLSSVAALRGHPESCWGL